MPLLVYRAAARRDIADIVTFIARESQSRAIAENFLDKLTGYCSRLASLPGLLGRQRPELSPGIRSIAFGSYVLFLRYADETGPRSHLYVVRVIHGARDVEASFGAAEDSSEET